MKTYHRITIEILNKLNIKYILGSDSLVGISEGNIYKYTQNLKLYVFPIKFFQLFLLLIGKKIILKPKNIFGHKYYKIRHKPNLFSKKTDFLKISIFEKLDEKKYGIHIGNKITLFEKKDLDITKIKFENNKIPVPQNYREFISKYKLELLSNFYKNHSIKFDSKSEKEAIDFLYQINDILKTSNLSYWIEGGTLLGAVRDKKLIPWDHDLDMGIINKSDKDIKAIIKKLKLKFYVSVKPFEGKSTWELGKYRVLKIYPKKWIFFRKKLCCDLFVYYKGEYNGEEVYKYVVWGKNAFHKKEYFVKTKLIDFYDKIINIPNNSESFLEVKYGKDWNIPKEIWNVALDDGSIVRS